MNLHQESGYSPAEIAAAESAAGSFDATVRADIEAFIGSVLAERERILEETEPEVVRLVMEIAGKVLRDETAANPDLVIGVVKHALRRVTNKERLRIRVNIADLPAGVVASQYKGLTRAQAAERLDKTLRPFEQPINFDGN